MRIGFDNEKYLAKQTENIRQRIDVFGGKLYLEFGGKLFDDYHAARVLPGFHLNSKIMMLKEFKEDVEIIVCINADDIEKNKLRADLNITYDQDVLRLVDSMRAMGLYVGSVVIKKYSGQPSATSFYNKLLSLGQRAYLHKLIEGYPTDVDFVVSDEGFGVNPYIETSRPLVVVTAPGPGSGKLATCLNQIYHEYRQGRKSGYAKYETFPVWNLPLKHPVNLAYEAATADLQDVNMIDPFHLDAYSKTVVNYNRDVEVFPIVRAILAKITGGTAVYKSPTDMGVNMAGFAICDDEAVCEASRQEIIRRHLKALAGVRLGTSDMHEVSRIELIMQQLQLKIEDRPGVIPARKKSEKCGCPCMAIQLADGTIITGKTTEQMDCSASSVLNAVKYLAGIDDKIHLLSPIVLDPILALKQETLHSRHPLLNSEEVLIALSICAATNPTAELAVSQLHKLNCCEAHGSHMVPGTNEAIFRKLGINLTYDAIYPTSMLYF